MSNRDVDTRQVIDEVRLRTQLWDASDPLYKNKDLRNKSWEDIAVTLFENVSAEDKQELGKLIKQRWRTARDAYFRTWNAMKCTPGNSAPKYKKYIYYDELRFLTSSPENEVDESLYEAISSPPEIKNDTASMNTDTSSNTVKEEQDVQEAVDFNGSQRPWIRRKRRRSQQTNRETLLSNQTSDLAADDLAFFFSLGPILRTFNLEQKLEFRSRVLRDAMEIINCNDTSSNSMVSTHSYNIRSPLQHDPSI